MELQTQILFRQNPKSFELLKQNSYYFKYLNRGTIDFKKFNSDMKEKYKERAMRAPFAKLFFDLEGVLYETRIRKIHKRKM